MFRTPYFSDAIIRFYAILRHSPQEIVWSTMEFLAGASIRTMFATHYHELTSVEGVKGMRNLNVEVDEGDDKIEFTYRIADGPASQSYGIQVAKLAGVPNSVLERAQEVLASLEGESGE